MKSVWEGIFVNDSYQSKIQKKLKSEKQIQDRCSAIKLSVTQWFVEFFFIFGRSDKKSYKENLSPFFATEANAAEFVTETYSKFEDRSPDKWNELLKNVFDEGKV